MTLEHFRSATKYHRNIIVSQSCTWTFKCVFCNWYFWQWAKKPNLGCDIPSNSVKNHVKNYIRYYRPLLFEKTKLVPWKQRHLLVWPRNFRKWNSLDATLRCHLAENCWTADRLVAPSLGVRTSNCRPWLRTLRRSRTGFPLLRCCSSLQEKRERGEDSRSLELMLLQASLTMLTVLFSISILFTFYFYTYKHVEF